MLYEIPRPSARATDDEWRTVMIKGRFGNVLASCCCTCVVLALILLQGCSGAAKIESTGHLPPLTTETFEEETKHVLNPETGELEKLTVPKSHTIVKQTPSETIEEEWKYVPNPETGELEKLLVYKTHTIVTETPSETIEEVWEYAPNPETGELEKFLVQRTHTTVTQTSSAIPSKHGGLNLEKLGEYLDLITLGLDVLIDIMYLTSK